MVNRETEDSAVVVLEGEGGLVDPKGARGTVSVSKVGPSRHVRFALYGENGGLEADLIDRTITLTRDRTRTVTKVEDVPTVVATCIAFCELVSGRGPNLIPISEGLASLALVRQAYAAASENPVSEPDC